MPCYNNIYQVVSLLYALSYIVLSTGSQGGLILSTIDIDIDTSNHIGVDNNGSFDRSPPQQYHHHHHHHDHSYHSDAYRRSNVRVHYSLIQESTADPSSTPSSSTALIEFPSTIPTIESSVDLSYSTLPSRSPSEADNIISYPSNEPSRPSDSLITTSTTSNPSFNLSNSSSPSSTPSDSPITTSTPSDSSNPSSIPSNSSIPSSNLSSPLSTPSSTPSDSPITTSTPSDSFSPSYTPSDSSSPSSIPSDSSSPSSTPSDSFSPSSTPSDSSSPSSTPSDMPVAISSGYVITYFEVSQILYGISLVDYTRDSIMYDSILKNTISTCMTRDDDVTVVANILIEDFIASSTSVILVHYSSSISMITLDYKVKSDFIDSSYTMLSSNLILSVTDGHFNALLRRFGNHTSLYECTSDSVTTTDLLQTKNEGHSNDSSRLPDSTIAVIIIAVMMCLLLITGGVYYYFHLLANADTTADQDINSEFILHQSMESCIQTTYRFNADESPAIVANPMYRHHNV